MSMSEIVVPIKITIIESNAKQNQVLKFIKKCKKSIYNYN